ncbi:ATP-binding protein [Eggerthia catenaformis]|uniref:ATP-binding protein n=1 Tax=Eggerthia catenaformis TaxID=31973 RepID=UPI00248D5BA5|nr:ATP-binding protein [Eggerthia catenaformis]
MSEIVKSLKVDARLISQLGEALIDSNKMALMELIKNSSDADATICKINIDTFFENKQGKGKITIEDNGNGMNDYIIENAFLKIASSFKNNYQKISPKFGRIAQGNKGIGRLSLNKLGKYVKVTTKLDTDFLLENYRSLNLNESYGNNIIDDILNDNCNKYYSFEINWEDFNSENVSIDDVSITIKHEDCNDGIKFNGENHGTKIEIFGIKDIEYWNDNNVVELIKDEINQLFNPFIEKESSFLVKVKVGSQPIFTNDILNEERIRKTSFSYAMFEFSSEQKKINVKLKRNKHYVKKEIDRLVKTMDNFNFTVNEKIDYDKQYELYSDASAKIDLCNFQKLKDTIANYQCDTSGFNLYDEDKIFLPGDFKGEIFAYDFSASKDTAEIKKYIENYLGVKVYRNNFRILPYGSIDNDWLDMSGYNTRVKSIIYKKHTTMGYVKVDGLENLDKIKEMTNRQGIQLDNYGENFILLMKNVIYRIIAKMEKDFNDSLSYPQEKILREKQSGEIVEISGIIFKKNYDPQNESKNKIAEIKKDLEEDSFENKKLLAKIDSLNKSIDDVNEYNLKKENLINKEYKYINELNPIIGSAIIAQSLAHEIKRLSNQIEISTKTIRPLCDKAVYDELDLISINCYYLSRYASVLDVNSRSRRRKYETFSIKEYLNSLLLDSPIFYYKGNNYKYKIIGEDFQIRGIKSNIKIIVENMILNSLYWLEYFNIDNPVINFELVLNARKMIIYDNGRGIDKNISDRLFEPFISNKPENEGRGMGLYIVSELLKDFGAIISLEDALNDYGNKYKFVIEFLED